MFLDCYGLHTSNDRLEVEYGVQVIRSDNQSEETCIYDRVILLVFDDFSQPSKPLGSSLTTTQSHQTTTHFNMFAKFVQTAILFALFSRRLQGAPTFQNTGTDSGWDTQIIEHQPTGSIQQVQNVVYKGPTALKMTQMYDPNYHDRYHSEKIEHNAYSRGTTGFYGFAFRLQDNWEFDQQSYNIAQFIADFTSRGCANGETYEPSSMIWLIGNQLHSRVKYGDPCSPGYNGFDGETATVSAGVWHKVVIQANWQSDPTGFYKVWFDGNKFIEHYNIPTTFSDGRSFDFHAGLYANGWYDDKKMIGSQGTRQVWIDQVGFGTMFSDADPDQWG